MNEVLKMSGTAIRRLGGATPEAWRDDWVFRWAAIGLVLTGLATVGGKMLDAHLEAMRAENRLHPVPELPLPPGVAVLRLPGAVPPQPAAVDPASPAVPRIAPGQPLDGSASLASPAAAGDRFGVAPAAR